MDAGHFDSLTRSLSAVGSRRRALALALIGALAPQFAGEGAAARGKRKKCKKINDKNRRKRCLKKAKKKANKSSCSDGVQNGSETAIDCGGGTCPRCGVGQTCASRDDCTTARCVSGTCQTCVNNVADCGTDVDGSQCACRDTVAGPRVCTKINCRPSTCADCLAGEQCAPAGADFQCCLPCGA